MRRAQWTSLPERINRESRSQGEVASSPCRHPKHPVTTPLFRQRLAGLEPFVAGFLGAVVPLGWSTTMIFSANRRGREHGRADRARSRLGDRRGAGDLGLPSHATSVRYLLLGLVVIAAPGCLTAYRAERAQDDDQRSDDRRPR